MGFFSILPLMLASAFMDTLIAGFQGVLTTLYGYMEYIIWLVIALILYRAWPTIKDWAETDRKKSPARSR